MFARPAWSSRPTSTWYKPVCSVCASSFCWLRQLRRVGRSLDDEFTRTRVSTICHSPGGLLQHGTRWYTEVCHWETALSGYLTPLHASSVERASIRPWTVAVATYRHAPDVADRVRFKRAITFHRRLHIKTPKYLTDCCVAVSHIAGRQRLRSAHRRQLDVPRYQRTTLNRRAFSVAGPTVWNSLPVELKEWWHWLSHRKHCFSGNISVISALEVLYDNALHKSIFYLLTYR